MTSKRFAQRQLVGLRPPKRSMRGALHMKQPCMRPSSQSKMPSQRQNSALSDNARQASDLTLRAVALISEAVCIVPIASAVPTLRAALWIHHVAETDRILGCAMPAVRTAICDRLQIRLRDHVASCASTARERSIFGGLYRCQNCF